MRPLDLAALLLALAPTLPAQAEKPASQPASKPVAQESSAKRDALRARAFQAQQKEEFSPAGDLFLQLSKMNPTDPEPYLLAGKCFEKSKRYNDALDVLEKGRKRFPNELLFSVGIARNYNLKAHDLLASSGKFDSFVVFTLQDSAREAKGVLEKHPDNRDMRLILAHTYYTLRKLDECKQEADELVKRFPDHPGAYILLGDLAFADYRILRGKLSEKGADTSKEAMGRITAARDLARKHYEKAISLDDKRVAAHRSLGDVHAWNGDLSSAIASYSTALILDPTTPIHPWVKNNIDAEKRYTFYKKVIGAYMKRPKADKKKAALLVFYAALAKYDQKQWKEAEEHFLACVESNPTYINSYYWAMQAAIQIDRNDRALSHCARFADVRPIALADLIRQLQPETYRKNTIRTLEIFTKTAYDQRKWGQARDISRVLVALLNTGEKWNDYAFLCRETRRYRESFAAYENALQIEPEDGQLMNDAAVILDYHLGTPAQVRDAEAVHKRLLETRRMIADASAPMDAKAVKEHAKANLKRAAEMYEEAAKLANRALKKRKLSKEDKQRLTIARRDARNNLRKLKRRLK